MKNADVFGIGDSSTGDHGYFGVANKLRGLPSPAVHVATDEVQVNGDDVNIKFVIAGVRGLWTKIRCAGLTRVESALE